jgi:hypothetical protein
MPIDLWNDRAAADWIAARHWLVPSQPTFGFSAPVTMLAGTIDNRTGIANFADCLLSEVGGVRRGLICIDNIFPPDRGPMLVFETVVRAFGGDPPCQSAGWSYYCHEYDSMLTLFTLCLSSDWEVTVIAEDVRFAIGTDEEYNIATFWPAGEPPTPTAVEALAVNGFAEGVPFYGRKLRM